MTLSVADPGLWMERGMDGGVRVDVAGPTQPGGMREHSKLSHRGLGFCPRCSAM